MDLHNKGWFKNALDTKPDMNGFPKIQQISEENETGVEKVTTQLVNKAVASIGERLGIPSNLSLPSLTQLYDQVKNVATAKKDNASSMTSALAAMIPGTNFNLSDLTSLLGNIEGMSGEVQGAMDSIMSILGSSSPLSGTNFAQSGTRIDPTSFANNIKDLFQGITELGQLDDVLTKILNDTSLHGLENLPPIVMEIVGPFGNVTQTLMSNGTIVTATSNAVQQTVSDFISMLGNIQVATGTLLGNSEILSDTFKRLPIDVQSAFKEAVGDNIPARIGTVINKSKEYLGL